MKKVLVLTSGGLDSTTLLKYLSRQYHTLGFFIDYGQPWCNKELEALERVKRLCGVNVNYERTMPLKVYEKNFVPLRNAHLLTIAVHRAFEYNFDFVAIGCCRGEFLDVAPEFIDRFNFMLDYCLKKPPYVLAPFAHWSKERVLKYGLKIGAPLEVTTTCMYNEPCGKCHGCKLRKKYNLPLN